MKKIIILTILLSIISSIFIHFYAFNRTAIYIDTIYHFFDMKQYFESKTIPKVGNRLMNSLSVLDNDTYARIPGGFYYILYLLCYIFGGTTIEGARIVYIIFSALILSIFLFWSYKRLSAFICAILSSLILTNGYVMFSTNDFWNPNIPLLFSFLLFIVLYEYILNKDNKYVFLSALLIFPIEAIMAQGHIAVFFSVVPTTIVYLIVRYKKTIKYIKAHLIGVFLAFLFYLPYLISEINNNFFNTKLMLNMQKSTVFKGLPQVYSIFLFPTNEISVLYGTNYNTTKYFWTENGFFIIGLVFLIFTVLISVFSFIYSVFLLTKKRELLDSVDKELFIFYLLFLPSTCFTFFIFNSLPGTFRYLYGIFAFSFVPIIIYSKYYIKNKNILSNIFLLLLILNTLNMGIFHLKRYYDLFEAPYTEAKFKNILTLISKDANGRSFKIVPYDEKYYDNMRISYFPNLDWNRDDNANLVYFIYYEIENVRLKTTGKSKNYDSLLKDLPKDAVLLGGDDKLKVYRYTIN